MNDAPLPSSWLPQRMMRAPSNVLRDVREFIDVDIVWDCDEGAWLILERCGNQKRAAVVNGHRINGWRAAAHYMDEDGSPYPLDNNLVWWLRSRDFSAYAGMSAFEEKKYGAGDRQKQKLDSDAWSGADERAEDKFKTAHGTRGTPKTKKIGDNRPLFERKPKQLATSGWGR